VSPPAPAGDSQRKILGTGYITKEALDTRWCHYQTLAPTQKGEQPAPEDENDREKGRNGHATPPGNTGTDPQINSAFLDGGRAAPHPRRRAAVRITHHDNLVLLRHPTGRQVASPGSLLHDCLSHHAPETPPGRRTSQNRLRTPPTPSSGVVRTCSLISLSLSVSHPVLFIAPKGEARVPWLWRRHTAGRRPPPPHREPALRLPAMAEEAARTAGGCPLAAAAAEAPAAAAVVPPPRPAAPPSVTHTHPPSVTARQYSCQGSDVAVYQWR
jgi:hypothetical protein